MTLVANFKYRALVRLVSHLLLQVVFRRHGKCNKLFSRSNKCQSWKDRKPIVAIH